MHHSSIFSSETHQATWRLSSWVLFFAGLLVAGELILRIPSVQAALPSPEPTLWHAPIVADKVAYFRTAAEQQGVDVLFVGNSTTQAGISPLLFDNLRGDATGGHVSFNGSIEGLPPTVNKQFLEMYLRHATPQTVIIGLTAQDLNSDSPWSKDMEDRAHSALRLQAEARDSWQGNVLAVLLDNSALFRYRYVFHQLLIHGGKVDPPVEVYFDERGWDAIDRSLLDSSPTDQLKMQNRAGVLNYHPEGPQVDALKQMIELARSKGANVVLVNLPLSDGYFNNFDSPDDYTRYMTSLTNLAAELQTPLWDMEHLPQGPAFGAAEFADLNHLNRTGAERLTSLLAQDYLALTAGGATADQ